MAKQNKHPEGKKDNFKPKNNPVDNTETKDFSGDAKPGKTKKPKNDGIPGRNDYTFYAASDQIARDIASIPFNYLGGIPFKAAAQGITVNNGKIVRTDLEHSAALESVFNVYYVPSVGVTKAQTDAINMATVQLYTMTRRTNSGAKNYEAADEMMYVLAMRDIYASFFEAKKIYGLVGLYNFFNHNLPFVLVRPYGVDLDDLRANQANYRARLNLLAKKINSFAVPKYFKAFDRAAFISSTIFTDSSSVRGQYFQYIKSGYYTWSTTTSERGTELIYTPYNLNSNRTFAQVLDTIEAQVDALFLDTDALTMSGDILKAFNDSDLYQIAETADNYSTPVALDEDALGQIENSICVIPNPINAPVQLGATFFNITQEDQLIKFVPKFSFTYDAEREEWRDRSGFMSTVMFNSHKDSPDYKDVLEWSRLMSVAKFTSDTNPMADVVEVESTGLEMVLNYSIARYDGAPDRRTVRIDYFTNFFNTIGSSAIVTSQLFTLLGRIAQYDWHPIIYVTANNAIDAIAGDAKVATSVDKDTIIKINDAAVYGAFFTDRQDSMTR